MISRTINFLVSEVNSYLRAVDSQIVQDEAFAGNIALLDNPDASASLKNRIVVTLVNLMEESALKNGVRPFEIVNGEHLFKNRPVSLNLYLLFSANYTGQENAYGRALRRLSQVVSFFQAKNTFNFQDFTDQNQLIDIRVILEIHSLSFEEINYLWGTLGGKQVPFALYKARLVQLEGDMPTISTPEIKEIQSQENLQ